VKQPVISSATLPSDYPDFSLGYSSENSPPVPAPLAAVPEKEEDQPSVPFSESLFYEGYSRTPTYIDQYERLSPTVKEGELTAKVFDLQDEQQLKDYNKLLADATNPYSPRALIKKTDTIAKKGTWKMLIHYTPLWYKILNK
jgi:hypothetical protein